MEKKTHTFLGVYLVFLERNIRNSFMDKGIIRIGGNSFISEAKITTLDMNPAHKA